MNKPKVVIEFSSDSNAKPGQITRIVREPELRKAAPPVTSLAEAIEKVSPPPGALIPITTTPIGVKAGGENHAARKHHPRSISKLNHFEDCAGFESSDGTSEAAEEGTRLHELMDKIMGLVISGGRGTTAHNALLHDIQPVEALSDDDFWLLSSCCKEVDKYLAKQPSAILNEAKVHIWNPDKSELTNGHQDLLLLFNDGETGILFDWKFGWKPVPASNKNKQGMGYALGSFMAHPKLKKLGVVFFQPRLSYITRHAYDRMEAWAMYKTIKGIIDNSIFVDGVFRVKENEAVSAEARANAFAMLQAGEWCSYCARAKCPKKIEAVARAGAAISGLPLPATFDANQIDTPEKMALVRHWAALLEPAIEDIKSRALEIAQKNGGYLDLTLPDGRYIRYEVQQKKHDRSLAEPPQVVEALKDFISPMELMAAATLQLGKVEEIVGAIIQSRANEPIESAVAEATKIANEKVAKGEWTKTAAAKHLRELKNTLGKKLTKKEAIEQLSSLLETQGLLTRPDGYVEFLKLKKAEKQIENTK